MSIPVRNPLSVPSLAGSWEGACQMLGFWVSLCLIGLVGYPGVSLGLESARTHMERGYDQLLQARRMSPGDDRDRVLTTAVKAFTKAYETSGPKTQVQVLIGAAQSYLLMQKSPARFPFLWSASPVQRAQRSVQHLLALEPDNPIAHLLMGLVLRRRESESTVAVPDKERQRASWAWARAAELGLPVQSAEGEWGKFIEPFRADGVVLVLRTIDLAGESHLGGVLWIYRPTAEADYCYGLVRHGGENYPLIGNSSTGRLAPTGSFDNLWLERESAGGPQIVLGWQEEGRMVKARFQWTGAGFTHLRTETPVEGTKTRGG